MRYQGDLQWKNVVQKNHVQNVDVQSMEKQESADSSGYFVYNVNLFFNNVETFIGSFKVIKTPL